MPSTSWLGMPQADRSEVSDRNKAFFEQFLTKGENASMYKEQLLEMFQKKTAASYRLDLEKKGNPTPFPPVQIKKGH